MAGAHPLGLNRFEWSVIRAALFARTQVENGHFLTDPGRASQKAAKTMVERGFLTQVGHIPQFDAIIVMLTDENAAAYNSAMDAAQPEKAP